MAGIMSSSFFESSSAASGMGGPSGMPNYLTPGFKGPQECDPKYRYARGDLRIPFNYKGSKTKYWDYVNEKREQEGKPPCSSFLGGKRKRVNRKSRKQRKQRKNRKNRTYKK
jgi:hypothetical protein